MAAAPAATAMIPSAPFSTALACELIVDHVVQHDAAVGVHRLVDLGRAPNDVITIGTRLFDDHRHVVVESVVGAMHDLIHGERCDDHVGVLARVRRILVGDLIQPVIEQRGRPRVRPGRSPPLRPDIGRDELGYRGDE